MAKRRKQKSGSNESTPLDDYKAFIDALVEIRVALRTRYRAGAQIAEA